MHEADRRPSGDHRGPPSLPAHGLVVSGEHGQARVRQWPSLPFTAHLLLYQQTRPPSIDDLARWCDELAALGFRSIRTSALASAASARVETSGFTVVQHLALLQHDDPRAAPAPGRGTRRLLVAEHSQVAAADRAAFGPDWSLDAGAIADVCSATPRHRARVGIGDKGGIAGYAITGRDSRQGFLQRLAVHPDHQRQRLGSTLVNDSLRWLARWRVHRALVNTPVDNEAALALYAATGFRRLPDGLRVYERRLA